MYTGQSDDPAFMTTRELADNLTRQQELQRAIAATMVRILSDDDRMRTIVNDESDRLWPTLASLARDFDVETALSLHKQLRDVVGNIAVAETNPPEPSCHEDD